MRVPGMIQDVHLEIGMMPGKHYSHCSNYIVSLPSFCCSGSKCKWRGEKLQVAWQVCSAVS